MPQEQKNAVRPSARVAAAHSSIAWVGRHLSLAVVGVSVPGRGTVSVTQNRAQERDAGTGMMVWDCAVAMCDVVADYDVEHPWSGRNVVELGAGTGVVGLCAAALGARVTLTDLDEIVPLMESCAERNRALVEDRVSCASLPWSAEGAAGLLAAVGPVDVVLVCECIVPRLFAMEPLVDTVAALLASKPGAVALVAYEHRLFHKFDPRDRLRDLLAAQGLALRPLVLGAPLAHPPTDDMHFWVISR